MNIQLVSELRRVANETGNNFFRAGAMQYFKSRVGRKVYANRYSYTSEQGHAPEIWSGRRRYTIRQFSLQPDGTVKIDTVGEFGEYDTSEDAIKAIKKILKENND